MYKRVVYFPVQTTRAFSHWSSEWVEDKELISFRIYTIYTEREREKQPVSRSASQPVTQLTAVTAAEWVKFKGRTSLKKRTNLSLLPCTKFPNQLGVLECQLRNPERAHIHVQTAHEFASWSLISATKACAWNGQSVNRLGRCRCVQSTAQFPSTRHMHPTCDTLQNLSLKTNTSLITNCVILQQYITMHTPKQTWHELWNSTPAPTMPCQECDDGEPGPMQTHKVWHYICPQDGSLILEKTHGNSLPTWNLEALWMVNASSQWVRTPAAAQNVLLNRRQSQKAPLKSCSCTYRPSPMPHGSSSKLFVWQSISWSNTFK